jgi:hypothetical protein
MFLYCYQSNVNNKLPYTNFIIITESLYFIENGDGRMKSLIHYTLRKLFQVLGVFKSPRLRHASPRQFKNTAHLKVNFRSL